jgi:hypothetical protein
MTATPFMGCCYFAAKSKIYPAGGLKGGCGQLTIEKL